MPLNLASIRIVAAGVTVAAGIGAAVLAGTPALGAGGSAAGCTADRLSAQMIHIAGSDAAGSTGFDLKISNHGGGACLVGSHPELSLLGSGSKPIPTHVKPVGRTSHVPIRPGKTVVARLRFSPDVPGPGEPQHGRCEPVAHHVKVRLTDSAHGSLVGPIQPPTSVCEHGSIEEHGLMPQP